VPWFRLDIHWYEDEKLEVAGERAGPLVFALYPVLIGKAKAQHDGGRAEVNFRLLAGELFTTKPKVKAGIEALASAKLLTCPQLSARSAVVAFDPVTWRRWQEADRKAAGRGEAKAA
jgi:hypothetical protein